MTDGCAQIAEQMPERSAEEILNEGLPLILAGYETIAAKLEGLVDPERVFITEYPDATRRDNGQYCGPTSAPGISESEWEWVDEVATASINEAVSTGAETHQWTLVSTIHGRFQGHGYCADEHWMVRLEESVALQGDIGGTAHPNAPGHEAMGAEITRALSALLDDDGTMTSFRARRL